MNTPLCSLFNIRNFNRTILTLCFSMHLVYAEAPYVGSSQALEGFETITPQQMEILRQKKILFASRSFGLNMYNGLNLLGKQNPEYNFLDSYKRYNVFGAGSDLSIIPADAFEHENFVHFLATYWPHTKRIEEVDTLLREPPWDFAKKVDVVMIYFHFTTPGTFNLYSEKMDALQADFPHIKFIYVCGGYMENSTHAGENAKSLEFNNMIKEHYMGKVPIYDLASILSKEGAPGFAEGYSGDPAGVHPDNDEGEIAMAKGFLVMLQQLYFPSAEMQVQPNSALPNGTVSNALPKSVAQTPIDKKDASAVQALLDANHLKRSVDGVAVTNASGRIVELYIQEAGVQQITADIGQLTELELLHCYGDRKLGLPLLHEVDPAIAKCTKLKTLLLNQNDLRTLPDAITGLKQLKLLSVGDNALNVKDQVLITWLNKYDPDWNETQASN